jgi:phospho-N-acetylmuramoyl-pentapeptide-transferase
MLYHLLYPLHESFGYLRIIRYISFRAFMAILTALFFCLVVGKPVIQYLKRKQNSSNIREDVPDSHLKKSGTPTMGGILIIMSMLFSFLLWGRLDNYITWTLVLCSALFSFIGLSDDLSKIQKKKNGGLTAGGKFKFQVGFSLLIGAMLFFYDFDTHLFLPFFKDFSLHLGWLFIPFVALVLVSSSNAVNLTDGLDGLAIGPTLVATMTFLIFSYITGNAAFAEYLQLPFVENAGELSIFCGAMFGACLGFLWFNTYPAQVFMGDVGSLTIGGVLGLIAIISKQEILLILVGGIFVMETLSVLIQVLSFRFTGKRVFKMAPIHHHFELKGWAEPKVIVRFWIISIILAILALSTLKLR